MTELTDFATKDGWLIDTAATQSFLHVGDVVFFTEDTEQAGHLRVVREGRVLLNALATYREGAVHASTSQWAIFAFFSGPTLNIQFRSRHPEGGPSPDDGGTSSGPPKHP